MDAKAILNGFNIGLLSSHGVNIGKSPDFASEVKRLDEKFNEVMRGCPVPPPQFVSQKDEE